MSARWGTVVAALMVIAGCASSPVAPPESGARYAPIVAAAAELPARRSPAGTALSTELARGERAFVALMRLEPGARIPAHQDESEEYLYVLEGGGEITIDGRTWTIAPGMVVFMPSMATVSYVNGPAGSVVVQVFADPRSAAKYEAWTPVTAP
ncbi:MAG: cupin domain-containing protein [Deltaproteobacteria bacterium]|nr:cupin domain-containing protein [Deltaproteobacteria bacterium]